MAASLTLKDSSGSAGDKVRITGADFKGGESVSIYVAGDHTDTIPTDVGGVFDVEVDVPAGTESGAQEITAVGSTSAEVASATYTVS
jgi:hypothetical protein